jgi:phage shock protein A
MGLFSRIWNIIMGIFFEGVEKAEVQHANVVYDQAIRAKIERFHKLRDAVGGLEANRIKLESRLGSLKRTLDEVNADLQAAIETNNETLGPILLQKKQELESQIPGLEKELADSVADVSEQMSNLTMAQADIDNLRREKEKALAQAQTDMLRKELEDEISRLSVDSSEIAALDNVRQRLEKLHGEAQVAKKLGETDVNRQLAKLRTESRQVNSKTDFKKLVEMSKAQAGAGKVEKTLGPKE